jgi:predicted Rossmann-fold nucleotide-binding protein
MRNEQMLKEGKPDAAVVFPGGAGTRDMLHRLIAARIHTIKVKPQGDRFQGT